jgi:Kdo2-lipid IVA lauroyltransferase/acyltransferase
MHVLIRAVFRSLAWLPLPLLHGLGWLLGWVTFLVSPTYRRRLLAHVRQAGYPWRLAFQAVGEAGKMVTELPRIWFGRPVRVGWEGAAAIEAAQAHGRGVLFLTPHLGCFEITAQAYADRFGAHQPMTVLFRPARQAWLRPLLEQARHRPGLDTASTTMAGVKQLIKALRSGQAVGLLPDQVPPQGQGVWADFFGREAYTMTLSARLARSAGAQVVLAWGERLSWGRGFLVHVRAFHGPLSQHDPEDPLAAARAINRAMEDLVKECPRQYLWAYDRYKQPRAEAHLGGAPA